MNLQLLIDSIVRQTTVLIAQLAHVANQVFLDLVRELGEQSDDLRARVDAYNDEHGIPERHRKVIAYAGQCVTEEEIEK